MVTTGVTVGTSRYDAVTGALTGISARWATLASDDRSSTERCTTARPLVVAFIDPIPDRDRHARAAGVVQAATDASCAPVAHSHTLQTREIAVSRPIQTYYKRSDSY